MLQSIIETLKKLNVENYRINEIKKSSAELFFIKKNLDMRRVTDQLNYNATVFCDFVAGDKKMRGSSSVILHSGMMDDEIKRILEDAYFAASFVKNPAYELAAPVKSGKIFMKSGISEIGLEKSAEAMAKALYEADNGANAFVNSAEIFAEQYDIHILTSNGTDAAFRKFNINGEFVVQCKEPQDVEQYKSFRYDDLNENALKQLVSSALNDVEARAGAVNSPNAGKYDILLTGDNLAEAMSYYSSRSNAAYIYPKYSNFAIDQSVQGENIAGEKLNISIKALTPFSDEGISMKDHNLIEDGVLKCIHGGTRFSRYLGVEPTGDNGGEDDYALIVHNGTTPIEKLRTGKVLEPLSFSDFQMDPFSGHFSGEIRLAFLYENGTRTALTGGSINGNIFDCQNNMIFTNERYDSAVYHGPMGMLVKDISVAGK